MWATLPPRNQNRWPEISLSEAAGTARVGASPNGKESLALQGREHQHFCKKKKRVCRRLDGFPLVPSVGLSGVKFLNSVLRVTLPSWYHPQRLPCAEGVACLRGRGGLLAKSGAATSVNVWTRAKCRRCKN